MLEVWGNNTTVMESWAVMDGLRLALDQPQMRTLCHTSNWHGPFAARLPSRMEQLGSWCKHSLTFGLHIWLILTYIIPSDCSSCCPRTSSTAVPSMKGQCACPWRINTYWRSLHLLWWSLKCKSLAVHRPTLGLWHSQRYHPSAAMGAMDPTPLVLLLVPRNGRKPQPLKGIVSDFASIAGWWYHHFSHQQLGDMAIIVMSHSILQLCS